MPDPQPPTAVKHALALVPALLAAATAQDAPELRFTDAFPGQRPFDRPLLIEHHATDPAHAYVVEQTGTIWRVPRDTEAAGREAFLSFRDVVLGPHNGGHNEEGLLGFCFDPAFADNGFCYVYYSQKTGEGEPDRRGRPQPKRQSVISRLRVERGADRVAADPESELVLFEQAQPWGNHNGGTIVFGPDGMLYVALGDGGAANDLGGNGQNLATVLAAVLRIDVRGATAEEPYRIPADNPFADTDGARGEIWAYGLRNPWRIAFDRATGDLWCGDVGQNLYEEVDRIVRGGNYGWPIREGLHGFPPSRDDGEDDRASFVDPLAEYPRQDGVSVTGGHVYRGTAIPGLVGWYVYGDFATRNLWAVREDRDGGEHEVVALGKAPGLIASFGEDADGELFVLCYEGSAYDQSHVYRMLPGGG